MSNNTDEHNKNNKNPPTKLINEKDQPTCPSDGGGRDEQILVITAKNNQNQGVQLLTEENLINNSSDHPSMKEQSHQKPQTPRKNK